MESFKHTIHSEASEENLVSFEESKEINFKQINRFFQDEITNATQEIFTNSIYATIPIETLSFQVREQLM